MPSQYSSRARHDVESMLAREIARQEVEDEIRDFLAETDAFRNKAARRRILEDARGEA